MNLPRLLPVLVFAFAMVPNAALAQREVRPYFQITGGALYGTDDLFGDSGIPLADGVLGARITPNRNVSYLAAVYGGVARFVGGSGDQLTSIVNRATPTASSSQYAGALIGAEARYKVVALSVTSGPGAFALRGGYDLSGLYGADTVVFTHSTNATLFGVQSRANGIVSFGTHFAVVASMHSTVMQKYRDNRIRLTGYSFGFRIE